MPTVCHKPKLVPTNVRLADPVDPKLIDEMLDWLPASKKLGESTDQLSDKVPDDAIPAVRSTCMLAAADGLPALHTTEDADAHIVASHAVIPSLAAALNSSDCNLSSPFTATCLLPAKRPFAHVS